MSINWRDAEKQWMKDPKFQQEVQKLEPEYQIAYSLTRARLKRKLSQAELAQKVGTKQPVISRIEAMASSPSVSLLKRVAHALDVKLEIGFSI